MEKKISLATFEQVAADNGYEVFTAEEVAAYYKDGLQKSMKNELTSDEKELFAADIAFLQKAICIDENGKEVTRYFRPEQVNWEKTEDGVLLKGIAGVFADTPTNRKLNRVGEAFVPSPDFMKSLESEEIDEDIIKAMRTGRYADTPENRRLHAVRRRGTFLLFLPVRIRGRGERPDPANRLNRRIRWSGCRRIYHRLSGA